MNDILDCPICNNNFDSNNHIPKFLNCGNGHTICLYCAQSIFDKEKNQFECPFDEKLIDI